MEITIGAKLDVLKNKTKIMAYHEGNLEALLDVLRNERFSKSIRRAKSFLIHLKMLLKKVWQSCRHLNTTSLPRTG